MKPKVQAFVGLCVLVLSAAGSVWYGVWLVQEHAAVRVVIDLPPARAAPVIPPGEQQAVAALLPEVRTLATPAPPADRRVDLSLFGYTPLSDQQGLAGRGPHTLPVHVVSMAFVSDSHRFCVIDGRFYGQGDTLDDGTRVAQVVPKRVLLDKLGVQEWVKVENTHQPDVAQQSPRSKHRSGT